MIKNNKLLSITRRTRATPFTKRIERDGAAAYTVYNHMLLPTLFESAEKEYWHLCEHVQVWDVSCERQVEVVGPDADKLVQLMTPRDLSKTDLLQGKYAPICDSDGMILNDPIIIKRDTNRWWISIADTDVKFFAKGLAQGYGMDVEVFEPDVFPLAVQGPKADELMSRVFGDEVRSIKFFRGAMLEFKGVELYVARSGWSKQGGFEIYLHDKSLAEPLYDELFDKGADLNVGPGYPHGAERLEAGLLSYGSDIDEFNNPFECGLDEYINLDADIESLSLPALRAMQGKETQRLVGLAFHDSTEPVDPSETYNDIGGWDIHRDGQIEAQKIGELRSHTWSFRYKKHLGMAMISVEYLDANSSVTIAGQTATILPLPFAPEALS